MSKETTELLEAVSKILLRCWILGFLLLTIWFGFFMLAPDVIYSLHGSMFGLSPHELSIIQYSAMAFVKLTVICFFFVPWLSIRLMMRRPALQRVAESPLKCE